MGFTDAGEQHFGGFRVARNPQRAIFFYNTSQCITHFIQVGLTFWENGDGVARLWEVNGFQGIGSVFVTGKRIASVGVGELRDCSEVACGNFGGTLLHFAARRDELSNALIGLRLQVIHMHIRLERPCIDPEIANGTDLRCRRLEDKH